MLRDVFRMLPGGVTVQDEHGRFLLMNDAAAAQLGMADGRSPDSPDLEQRRETGVELLRSGRAVVAEECVTADDRVLHHTPVTFDASLAEINPLLITQEGGVLALDCKMNFDDNALFRHKDVVEMRDQNEEDPLEVEASHFGLNYIKLDGNVGCMVNGAGLAMGTMDIIKLAGGQPANFLDVGGGASAEQVGNAFRIILSDKNVKAILINIFGGIMRCDRIAEGVVSASREVGLPVPVVVRLEGTNVELGKEILAKSGLPLITADGMWDAAQKVVAAAKAARPS